MDDSRRILKRSLEQACTALRVRFSEFAAAVGLNDFLLDAFDVPRTAQEIAVRALEQLCAGDKRLHDHVVCLAVVSFLDETLGPPREDPDRFVRLKDLASLLASPCTRAQFERWIETWYE